MDPNDLQPYFPHPLDKTKKVYVMLDVCHMLKLIRNTLGVGGILLDKEVMWQYIVELENLQRKEGLRLGNKLKRLHIGWRQQKMKVIYNNL